MNFLEPVYLNEKMVLNCAAYLWKGVAMETESKNTTDSSQKGSANIGLSFLNNLVNLFKVEGEVKKGTVEENKSARRYTVGGLHMAVLDELGRQNMIQHVLPTSVATTNASYVVIQAVLRPVNYYALIGTLKTILPLGAQMFRDFGEKLLPQQPNQASLDTSQPQSAALADRYEKSLSSLLEKLEADYLTSKQLEMIMSDASGTPIGVVDLDMSDNDPAQMRAKLTGGSFHVIGKIVNKIKANESLNLMQRSVLSAGMDLINKAVGLNTDQAAIQNYVAGIDKARPIIEKFLEPSLPGPLVRVLAMSVCI